MKRSADAEVLAYRRASVPSSRGSCSILPDLLRGQTWLAQVSGEALYTDDVPLPANALHAVLVKSTRPHAKITSVDPSAALQVGS